MFATSVLRFCRHLRNLASQSQWDRVNGELLHMPLMHSLGDIVIGQWSCSLQQASSPAWWPRSSYDFAKVPGPHHFVPGYIRPLPGGWFFPLSREALHVSTKSATRFADICRTFFGSAPRIIFWITPRSVYKAQKGASAFNSTILDIVVSATRTLASVSSPQSVGINSRNTASILKDNSGWFSLWISDDKQQTTYCLYRITILERSLRWLQRTAE